MDILIKLLIAHALADFLLQWPAMLKSKAERKFASPLLYVHGVIHFALSFALLRDINMIPALLMVTVSHIVIDALKCTFTNPSNSRKLFFADQLAHLVILVLLANYFQPLHFQELEKHPYFYPHILCLTIITFPTSIALQIFFSRWQLPSGLGESLHGAGVYIGYIERLLIYVAVVTHNWNIVGFLLAAKSVIRFGDLNKADDRKFAEYVLIGTLISMTSAILCGLGFLWLTGQAA